MGRQRSISDLLSSSCESQTSPQLPPPSPNNQMMGNYNPYAADRSISIPPPTPPPFMPSTPVDPINRATSLPPAPAPAPGAPPAAPPMSATASQRPPGLPPAAPPMPATSGRPGLPPPHPVHQMLQKQEEAAHQNNLPISIPPQNPAQERPELGRSQNEEVAGSPGRGQRHQKIRITVTETSPAPSQKILRF